MATVKAFIRTSSNKAKKKLVQVNVRFRLSDGERKQLFYCSNLTVDPDNWDSKQQCIKAKPSIPEKDKIELNASIANIKSIIQQIYLAEPARHDLTSTQFADSINRILNPERHIVTPPAKQLFFDVFDEYLSNRKVSKSQIAHNQVLKRMLQRFELYQKTLAITYYKFDLDTFNASTIDAFEQFLIDEHELCNKHPRIYKAIPETRKPAPRGRNTINGWLTSLRTFFIWTNNYNKTTNNPFKNYRIEECVYGTPIYITLEERNKIWGHDFSNNKHLEVCRDIFIFQCHIGCRVGDLFKMTAHNVMGDSIEYIPRKTKEGHPYTVSVPLTKTAQEIIAKYSAEATISGKLLPFTYEQEYNRAIKKIFELACITRMVTFLNPTTREETKVPINTIAASHMARKTFIGNMYKKVKNATLVGALSGHVEGSKAFARYRNIDAEMKKELISIIE